MRIGIDATWAGVPGSGTASYTTGLVRALARRNAHELVLYFAPRDAGTNPLWDLTGPRVVRRSTAARPQPLRSLGALAVAARRDHLDLFHSPGYFLPLWGGPKVVSFHDANMFLEWRRRWIPGARLDTASLAVQATIASRLAHQIMTLTQSSASDIRRVFRLPHERVSVVYPGIDDAFFEPVSSQDGLLGDEFGPGSYILAVGEITPQKNVEGLIQAFAMLDHRELILTLAGRSNSAYREDRLLPLMQRLGISNRVSFLGIVPQRILPALYTGAAAFVLPSFSEGFGLPIIEAMACGAPVVASDRSSVPEVAGDAALLVDPGDPEQIATALTRILDDAPLRRQLRARGRENARRFRWDRTAQTMSSIYETVLRECDG